MRVIKKLLCVGLAMLMLTSLGGCSPEPAIETEAEPITIDSFCAYYDARDYTRMSSMGEMGLQFEDINMYYSDGLSASVEDECWCREHNGISRSYYVDGYDKYYQYVDWFTKRYSDVSPTYGGDGDTYEYFSIVSRKCCVAIYRIEDECVMFLTSGEVPHDEGYYEIPEVGDETIEKIRGEMRDLGLEIIV